MFHQAVILLTVFFPLAAAPVLYALIRRHPERESGALITCTLVETALAALCWGAADVHVALPGVFAMGLSFQGDGLALILCPLTAFAFLMSALAHRDYFAGEERTARYVLFLLLTQGALMGMFLSGDLLTTYVFFEMLSLCSCVWVAQNETREALAAADTYLAIAIIGGLTLLMGLLLLHAATGTLDFDHMRAAIAAADNRPVLTAAGVCMLVGFGAKAGCSRCTSGCPGPPGGPGAGQRAAVRHFDQVGGVRHAGGQRAAVHRLPHVVRGAAHPGHGDHGVGRGFGPVLGGHQADAGLLLPVPDRADHHGHRLSDAAGRPRQPGRRRGGAAHGQPRAVKVTLFLCAGALYTQNHTLDLNDLRGAGRGQPVLLICFLIGAAGLAGVPGLSGYVSKTLLHEALLETIPAATGTLRTLLSVSETLFTISGGLTLAYLLKLFIALFVQQRDALAEPPARIGPATALSILLPSLLILALGLLPERAVDALAGVAAPFLGTGAPHTAHYFSWHSLQGALLSLWIGTAVYLLLVLPLLSRRGEDGRRCYVQRWPKWLDLERSLYRPALEGARFVLTLVVRTVASLPDWLVHALYVTIFSRGRQPFVPPEDDEFGRYRRTRPFSFRDTFSYLALLCALGLTGGLVWLVAF